MQGEFGSERYGAKTDLAENSCPMAAENVNSPRRVALCDSPLGYRGRDCVSHLASVCDVQLSRALVSLALFTSPVSSVGDSCHPDPQLRNRIANTRSISTATRTGIDPGETKQFGCSTSKRQGDQKRLVIRHNGLYFPRDLCLFRGEQDQNRQFTNARGFSGIGDWTSHSLVHLSAIQRQTR